jgi:hypothetical protein
MASYKDHMSDATSAELNSLIPCSVVACLQEYIYLALTLVSTGNIYQNR